MMLRKNSALLFFLSSLAGVWCLDDTLGLGNGYITINTTNFNVQLVRDAQVLVSLTAAGDTFDFLPFDLLSSRASNNQYHWGDITFRYREDGATTWIDGDSAAARQAVSALNSNGTLAAADLSATLPKGPINVTREWLDVSGDLGLRFTLTNTGTTALELGSLGFPAEFNSIFTNRAAADIQRLCSLSDPYVGLDAGYIRANPVRGTGAALVVTPLPGTRTPLEAYRNLDEPSVDPTDYGSQTFEGFYEWQTLSAAWAGAEWAGAQPWNAPSARALAPGEALRVGLRFSLAPDGVRGIDAALRALGRPVAFAVPGYIVPRGEPARLFLRADAAVSSIASEPAGALAVAEVAPGEYTVTPAATAWGRARLTVAYADGAAQTIHYHVTKASGEALDDLGAFLTTEQWFDDADDPFGRAPSPLTYDHDARAPVAQEPRVWIAGLSDEGGAGPFVAAAAKQALRPAAGEVAKLAAFAERVLWGTVQHNDSDTYAVRKSAFYYDPAAAPPGYAYDPALDWGNWWSWDRADAAATDRAYDYVHVAAAHWALYRVARAYFYDPVNGTVGAWDTYLARARGTLLRAMQDDVAYRDVGLMGETVFGEILRDLRREGWDDQADAVEASMRARAQAWDAEEVPYGSEMAWDSTGQEGVYYWAKYFGFTETATKTVNSVLGYMPTVPHWGWDGNARRYWDNIYAGKLQRIERQIHHYGSALNAQVLLSAFRADPTDTYLLAVGYAGASGPLSNIHEDGFAAASFHSFPDTLRWDAYSGDYGPGFLGLALGSGTYVARHAAFGLLAYGGVLEEEEGGETVVGVRVTGPVARRIFIGPLGVELSVDAGAFESFRFVLDSGLVEVTLVQPEGAPVAEAAVLWVEGNDDAVSYNVSSPEVSETRGGWRIPLSSGKTVVELVRN
ncbi:hypothetical protein F4809DRAFT_661845 [Biscogniauxia mediterranea]|nr:hypothetical protein F4809DRAFT_661845 [Biscogniauxia mediterranea]